MNTWKTIINGRMFELHVDANLVVEHDWEAGMITVMRREAENKASNVIPFERGLRITANDSRIVDGLGPIGSL